MRRDQSSMTDRKSCIRKRIRFVPPPVNTLRISEIHEPGRIAVPMENSVAKRLRWAREDAGYATAADFARKLGVEVGTYRHHENGTRGLRVPTARRYAKVLNIDVNWLLTGEGAARSGDETTIQRRPIIWAPIISWIQAGSLSAEYIDFSEIKDRIPVAHFRRSVVALRVRGTSMNRVAAPGDLVIVDYEDKIPQDGKIYVVEYEGHTTLKRYRDTKGPVRLEPDSTEEHDTIFPNADFRVIGRVLSVQKVL